MRTLDGRDPENHLEAELGQLIYGYNMLIYASIC